jgi:ubiquinone/menaquinone biosynthesis C-methylase UbiE
VVTAFDVCHKSLREIADTPDCFRVAGHAATLPFRSGNFDLVYSQLVLLWTSPLEQVLAEIYRVLMSGGTLAAIEPDFAGFIEHPPAMDSRNLWIAALTRAGAEPRIGRMLPEKLESLGFHVEVFMLDKMQPGHQQRLDFLKDLPLNSDEQRRLVEIERHIQAARDWQHIAYLPMFLIAAKKD